MEKFLLAPGLAVVSDSFPKELAERLNGAPTIVVTASEALAALDAED